MHRFFCPSLNISAEKITLNDKKQIHHLKDVLRIRPKDAVTIFDEKGTEYLGYVERALNNEVVVRIQEIKSEYQDVLSYHVTLAVALQSKNRMEYLIEKCTELGVDAIIPMETGRTVISLTKDRQPSRIYRWNKLAMEASQQSGRNIIPQVSQVMKFSEALRNVKDYDLAILCSLIDERKYLGEILFNFQGRRILALIGPEGDFTPQEVSLGKEAGCILVSLGQAILKVDTAAIVVMAGINLINGIKRSKV